MNMEEAVRVLFRLDKDEGYAVRIEIWPDKEGEVWNDDFMIHPTDLDKGNANDTVQKLLCFLSTYKKKPIYGEVKKRGRGRPRKK